MPAAVCPLAPSALSEPDVLVAPAVPCAPVASGTSAPSDCDERASEARGSGTARCATRWRGMRVHPELKGGVITVA
eukprot:1220317-Prymnesium_polylepis.1